MQREYLWGVPFFFCTPNAEWEPSGRLGGPKGKLPEVQKKPLFTLRIILHYSTEWNEKKTDEKGVVP